jgi:DNA-binding CsgD family transcriptional regulator
MAAKKSISKKIVVKKSTTKKGSKAVANKPQKAAKKKPNKKPNKKPAATPPPPAEDLPTEDEKKRIDWEINNELISKEFFEVLIKKQKMPTYVEIAKKLNMNERTVRRHFADTKMFDDMKTRMQAVKEKVLLTLSVKAIKGESHHFVRLFFEVVDGLGNKDKNPNELHITVKRK